MGRTAWTVLNLTVDAVFYNAAIVLAFVVRFGWPIPGFNFEAYETVVIPLTLGQLLIFFLVGLYDPAADRSGPELLGTVVKGLLLGVLVLIALTFVFRAFSFPRSVVVLSFLAGLLLLWGWRRVAADLLHVKWPERRVVLVGAGPDAGLVLDRLQMASHWGYRVLGVVVPVPGEAENEESQAASADPGSAGPASMDLEAAFPVYEGLGRLPDIVAELEPDQVIVATPGRHRQILEQVALSPRFDGEILVLPQLYEMHLGELSFGLLQDLPLIRLTQEARAAWRGGLKEVIERFLAGVLLVALSPALAVIAVAVLVFTGRPILYVQERVGRDGEVFMLAKFRTMVPDAENDGPVLAVRGDPRITGIGGFLRVSRLDEFPQLWNVLLGEMSFVGPRPERPEFVRDFIHSDPLYGERLRVRPGITGLAQVSAYYASSAAVKMRFDLMYVYHQSLALDLRIIARTVQVVLTGKGAV